jgi:hypothetical protein
MPNISDSKNQYPFGMINAEKCMQDRADHLILKQILPDELIPKNKRVIIKEKHDGEKT